MLLLKGINKVLGKYRGGSHCQVSHGNVMKEVTSELALEEDKQKFSRRILCGSRLGTWLLTSKTCLSVSRSLGRALSYLKGCDEEGRKRLPFPSEEYTSHMGRCMGSH